MDLQENIKRIKEVMNINEGFHNTYWADDDGNKITLIDLLDATEHIPIQNIPIVDLKPHLLSWDDDEKEFKKIDNVELEYPILVFVNNECEIITIIDGHHRIHKAIKKGMETIKGKLIKLRTLPKNVRKVFNHLN